ncbi:MAG: TonB-dependent receptor [Acidobacteriota bacterium]
MRALGVFSLLLAAAVAPGQEFRGTILGRVLDTSGAVVPRAAITVTNTETRVSVKLESAENGNYTVPFLIPGRYRVAAQVQGFKAFVREGIEVQVQDRVHVDVVLEPGVVTETVLVRSEAPLLEASTASVGEVIDQTKIINLPLNGRNPYLIARIAPGVQPTDARSFARPFDNGATSNISMGGNPNSSNDVLLDGIPNVDAGNTVAFIPSVEAVQELKVQTNTFDAEFGRAAGGVVNVTVKSGTNILHGALQEFWRNDHLEANNFFNNRVGQGKPRQRFHMFGANAGGPVYLPRAYDGRNRTFIFGSWESIRQTDPTSLVATVPTREQRAGDFSKTYDGRGRFLPIFDPFTSRPNPARAGAYIRDPFPDNRIPRALLDPVALKILELYGQPNQPGLPFSADDNFFWSGSSPDNYDAFIARLDHNFSSNQRMFARVSASRRPRLGDDDIFETLATQSGFSNRLSRGAALDYVNSLRPNVLLNVRYGLVRYGNIYQYRPADFKLTSLGFPASLAGQVMEQQFPRIEMAGIVTVGQSGNSESLDDVHTLQANMTRIGSRHTMKWGGDIRVYRDVGLSVGYASGSYSFNQGFTRGPDPVRDLVSGHSVASFLLGTPSSGSIPKNVGPAFQNVYYAGYLQDDVRISPRLTVNLGLRYEYEGPRTERYNQMTRGFAFNTRNPLQERAPALGLWGGLQFAGVGGQPRGQTDPERLNFAPRFGVAWQVNSRVVVRAGYGVFFAGTSNYGGGTGASPGFSVSTPMVTSLDSVTPQDRLSNPFPKGLLNPIGSSQGLSTLLGQGVSFVDVERRSTYTQQYSVGIQFEPVRNLLIETAYVGNRGLHLRNNDLQLNQISEESQRLEDQLLLRVPNPFFGLIETGSLASSTTTRGQLLRPYPHFTGVSMRDPTIGSATYHSFQLKVERRLAQGFTLLAAYTNAKLLDDIGSRQSHRNLKAERALSSINRPQRLVLSGVYEIPLGPGQRYTLGNPPVMRKLLEGWQLNWLVAFQGGGPLTVTSAVNNTNSFGGGQRPDSTGRSAKLSGSVTERLNRYFDTSQFVDARPFQFGNLARTLPDVRGPGLNNFDISVIKNTTIRESLRLQFRCEGFNVWNHPAFENPGTSFGTGSFGRINALAHRANPARQIMLAMKLVW